MAGEYNPETDSPSTTDRASKVLLRLSVMEGCFADKATSEIAFRDAVRRLGEVTTGEVITAQPDDHSAYLGVSGTEDLDSDLRSAVLTANDTIRANMLPYQIDGARASSSTFNVSAGSVWRNLSLNPATDVSDRARQIIDTERDQMWEAERDVVFQPSTVEGH